MDAGNIGHPALMDPEFDLIQDAELTFSISMCFSFAVQLVSLSSHFALQSTDVYSVTSTVMFQALRPAEKLSKRGFHFQVSSVFALVL
jgi:hypothetical protein